MSIVPPKSYYRCAAAAALTGNSYDVEVRVQNSKTNATVLTNRHPVRTDRLWRDTAWQAPKSSKDDFKGKKATTETEYNLWNMHAYIQSNKSKAPIRFERTLLPYVTH